MSSSIRDLSESLYQAKGWIKLAGIMSIIQGVIGILSLWGILISWVPIWIGIILLKASNGLGRAYEMDDATELQQALARLAKYFKIYGILMLIAIIIGVIAMLAAILIPAVVSGMNRM